MNKNRDRDATSAWAWTVLPPSMIVAAEGDTKTSAEAALSFCAAELPAPLLRLALNGRFAGVVVTSEMVSGESRTRENLSLELTRR